MTITTHQVIFDAYADLNVLADGDVMPAAKGSAGLRKLNQMMELLKEKDVDIGYFAQSTTTGTCPIPDWAEGPVTNLLSAHLAPRNGASLSIELATIIDNTVNTLKRKMISEKLDNADLSHMPIGEGYWGRRYDISKG